MHTINNSCIIKSVVVFFCFFFTIYTFLQHRLFVFLFRHNYDEEAIIHSLAPSTYYFECIYFLSRPRQRTLAFLRHCQVVDMIESQHMLINQLSKLPHSCLSRINFFAKLLTGARCSTSNETTAVQIFSMLITVEQKYCITNTILSFHRVKSNWTN